MISVDNCALSDQRIRLLTSSAVIVVVVVLVPTLHEKKVFTAKIDIYLLFKISTLPL